MTIYIQSRPYGGRAVELLVFKGEGNMVPMTMSQDGVVGRNRIVVIDGTLKSKPPLFAIQHVGAVAIDDAVGLTIPAGNGVDPTFDSSD